MKPDFDCADIRSKGGVLNFGNQIPVQVNAGNTKDSNRFTYIQ